MAGMFQRWLADAKENPTSLSQFTKWLVARQYVTDYPVAYTIGPPAVNSLVPNPPGGRKGPMVWGFFYLPTYMAMGFGALPGFAIGLTLRAVLLTWITTAAAGASWRSRCGTRCTTCSVRRTLLIYRRIPP